jgi:hypothetical protein
MTLKLPKWKAISLSLCFGIRKRQNFDAKPVPNIENHQFEGLYTLLDDPKYFSGFRILYALIYDPRSSTLLSDNPQHFFL